MEAQKLENKNSSFMEFFSNQSEIEKYARIGKIAHELFHDLLNPITGFILYIDLINKNKIPETNLTQQISEISSAVKKIRKFIKLVQNSIENQDLKENLDLNQNIKEIMKLLYYKAKVQKVSLIFIGQSNIKIKMAKIKLYQMIINLLTNAVDSFQEISDQRKRQIIIKTKENKNYIDIIIQDNGCGISENEMNQIFQKRLKVKKNHFGIGLKTIKKIVRENGGKILLKSQKNVGTEFKILLPKNH